jgi:hypothetical protein
MEKSQIRALLVAHKLGLGRRMEAEMLRRYGIGTVEEADHDTEALNGLKQRLSDFDIVIWKMRVNLLGEAVDQTPLLRMREDQELKSIPLLVVLGLNFVYDAPHVLQASWIEKVGADAYTAGLFPQHKFEKALASALANHSKI